MMQSGCICIVVPDMPTDEPRPCVVCGAVTLGFRDFKPSTPAARELSGIPTLFHQVYFPMCRRCSDTLDEGSETDQKRMMGKMLAGVRRVMPGSAGEHWIDRMEAAGIYGIADLHPPRAVAGAAVWLPYPLPAVLPACTCIACPAPAERFKAMPLGPVARIFGSLSDEDVAIVFAICGGCQSKLDHEKTRGPGMAAILRAFRLILGTDRPDLEKLQALAERALFIKRMIQEVSDA